MSSPVEIPASRRRLSDEEFDAQVARHSPTLVRPPDPNDPAYRERQRDMDVDMAMQLSRARRETISASGGGPSPVSPGMVLSSGGVHAHPTSEQQQLPPPPLTPQQALGVPELSSSERHDFDLAKGTLDENEEDGTVRLGGLSLSMSPDTRVMADDDVDDETHVGGRDRDDGGAGVDNEGGRVGVSLGPGMLSSPTAVPLAGFLGAEFIGQDPSLLVTSQPHSRPQLSSTPTIRTPSPHLPRHQHTPPVAAFNNQVGLPTYQDTSAASYHFDFSPMEIFALEEKKALGLTSPTGGIPSATGAGGAGPSSSTATAPRFSLSQIRPSAKRKKKAQVFSREDEEDGGGDLDGAVFDEEGDEQGFPKSPSSMGGDATPKPASARRQRRLSHSTTGNRPRHRKGIGGKLALFEAGNNMDPTMSLRMPGSIFHGLGGGSGGGGRRLDDSLGNIPPGPSSSSAAGAGMGGILTNYSPGHDRPYRFSFYSNALGATIHARSLGELPADGQSFSDLFRGIFPPPPPPPPPSDGGGRTKANGRNNPPSGLQGRMSSSPPAREDYFSTPSTKKDISQQLSNVMGGYGAASTDDEASTWWLDILCPTDEEMKMLSKTFGIHPLTTEDILMEEAREKIELFKNYYLVCFRSFEQDPYSPTYLEPLNMYIIVFREGTLSFHFRQTSHPQSVRRRIKQLKDYISVTSDWISYALIDDITDAFGPLIQSIEYEVDSIDELVLILKEAESSDMLRRIGTCRKKVMGLLRLMGNKADVVKGLAKRCNENWRVAPTSDIGLYLSDIQDHLITMTQNLNHYEKILSRSHSNYLAQISIEITDANNQINDVLSKLTALGTVLIPMNLVTGLWGMNVHVPGEGVEGYMWFGGIIAVLVCFACVGGFVTYRFMVQR